jgi:hypothetical protein
MARDDDYDDEEYRPRKRRDEQARGMPVGVIIGLTVAAIVLLGAVVLLVARTREARDQARAALSENEAQLARAVAEHEMVPEKSRSNWEKVIGTWVREPGPKDKAPYRFEFRKDKTMRTVRTNYNGQPQETEGRLTVMADSDNILWIKMDVTGGTMSYQFQLMEDGALALPSEPGDVRFTRLK